ncbi:MAG TPA: fibronectin type III domain-containing protein [Thermoanaerobaculia bacterium]|nr:fibronectin type III domain-containing protein [Thermoanaerobaculia bacterium]
MISAALLLPDGTETPAANSRSIRLSFGSSNFPQFGNSFAVLSTGHAAAPGQTNPSFAAFQPGAVMGTLSGFPPDWLAANGGQVPTVTGCPELEGQAARDGIMLKLRIRVPADARSFSVSTRMFVADYPEYVCSPYHDFFAVLLDSGFTGTPANPADKNLARHVSESGAIYPIGATLAWGNTGHFTACKNGPTGCAQGAIAGTTATCTGTTDLAETGFDTPDVEQYCDENNLVGGGTAWLTLRGNVVPGEIIELRFALWDTADGSSDSVALIDNFQWSAELATPGLFLPGEAPSPDSAPVPPAGLLATAQTSTSVLVEWSPSPSATSYHVFRKEPGGVFVHVGTTSASSFWDLTAVGDRTYLYRARALNGAASSTDSAPDIATTVAFTDDPLVSGSTTVKAVHLSELRSVIDAARSLAGLGPAAFTDAASPGVTIKSVHVAEMRTALDAALTALGIPTSAYTDTTLTGTIIKAQHFQEIRSRLK